MRCVPCGVFLSLVDMNVIGRQWERQWWISLKRLGLGISGPYGVRMSVNEFEIGFRVPARAMIHTAVDPDCIEAKIVPQTLHVVSDWRASIRSSVIDTINTREAS